MECLDCSVIVFDIRDFTRNLIIFTKASDILFIKYIEHLQNTGLSLAKTISPTNFFYNSTGDGFVLIFFGELHYVDAYIYSIFLNKIIDRINSIILSSKGHKFSYGIGADSGTVYRISISYKSQENYIGNVINTAARIESETKSHSRAKVIIGSEMNQKIVKYRFNDDYSILMKTVLASEHEDKALEAINKMNDYNQKLMLSYIFEHNLKGVEYSIPLFRLSPSLSDEKKGRFKIAIEELLFDRKELFENLFKFYNGRTYESISF